MATLLKVLGQSSPSPSVLTDIYTVPAATQTVVSSLIICNRSSSSTEFRISIAVNGASDSIEQYIYYDVPIEGNDTFIATVGISLYAGDVVRVYNTLSTLSFSLFGQEVS